MNLDFNLNLSQQQKLAMTQHMQLSIKILQMSSCELRELINKELEENPIIDGDFNINKDIELEQYKKMLESMEYDNNYNLYSKGDYDEEWVSPLNLVSEKETLKKCLYEQLYSNKQVKGLIEIIEYMIESLDNRGYLDETIENICKKFNISEEKCVQALCILQSLEPSGVGCRDIKECLLIQLKKENRLNSHLEEIINKYLELVADNKFKDIAKYLGITQLEAQDYGDIIKSLEPKPARGYYTGDETKFITPDAYIKKIGNDYVVIMNNDVVPQLSINGAYKSLLLQGSDREVENYIKEKIGSAMFLIKSINNRENTLKVILEDIIKKQREYLDKGKKYLKPMLLKDIAEDIKMHESTVSRAIKDKYILTNYGTIKIKDLFATGYSSKGFPDEKGISTKNIKDIIKDIIENENKKKPFSDEMICKELTKKNLNISRRTVAKYREEMGIKSSSKRKRI